MIPQQPTGRWFVLWQAKWYQWSSHSTRFILQITWTSNLVSNIYQAKFTSKIQCIHKEKYKLLVKSCLRPGEFHPKVTNTELQRTHSHFQFHGYFSITSEQVWGLTQSQHWQETESPLHFKFYQKTYGKPRSYCQAAEQSAWHVTSSGFIKQMPEHVEDCTGGFWIRSRDLRLESKLRERKLLSVTQSVQVSQWQPCLRANQPVLLTLASSNRGVKQN